MSKMDFVAQPCRSGVEGRIRGWKGGFSTHVPALESMTISGVFLREEGFWNAFAITLHNSMRSVPPSSCFVAYL